MDTIGHKPSKNSCRLMTLAKLALWFVGNASVQISHERRKRAIKEMNGKLVELAEKDSIYKKAAAMLFSLSSPRRQRRERTSGGPWTGLLTTLTLKDLRIFRAATLTVSMEGGMNPSHQGYQFRAGGDASGHIN